MEPQNDTSPSPRTFRRAVRAARSRRRAREGMTLVEIMIVVIIMAMIAAAVGVAVLPRLNDARIEQARTDAQSIRGAVEMYLAQNPSADCPSVDELVSERILSSRSRTADPWDNPFSVECEGEDITVVSGGPDGQMGTEDDVQ
ncbi:MAG: type II secretion system protein GspG [Deltaproteobacteria bacterium]|jgi:general secretion pathway protein G